MKAAVLGALALLAGCGDNASPPATTLAGRWSFVSGEAAISCTGGAPETLPLAGTTLTVAGGVAMFSASSGGYSIACSVQVLAAGADLEAAAGQSCNVAAGSLATTLALSELVLVPGDGGAGGTMQMTGTAAGCPVTGSGTFIAAEAP